MDDDLERIREGDKRASREREERRAAHEKRKAAEREYDAAWDAVIHCCQVGDQDPNLVPDLSPFLRLLEVLKARGWDEWLTGMSKNLGADLDSNLQESRDQLFIVKLLQQASIPGGTVEDLQAIYVGRKEGQRTLSWRTAAAGEVRYFFFLRIPHAGDVPTIPAAEIHKPQQMPVRIKKKNYALAMGWSPRKMTTMVSSGRVPICEPATKQAQTIVIDLLQVPAEKREAVRSKAERDI